MKIFKYIILPVLAALSMISCEKDGEIITITPPTGEGNFFGVDRTEAVLLAENGKNLVMTFYWNDEALYPTLSNPAVSLPYDISDRQINFSTDENFTKVAKAAPDGGKSTLQFTVSDLNNIMVNLGCREVRSYDIYTKMVATIDGIPYDSEVVKLKITPYAVDPLKMDVWHVIEGSVTTIEKLGAIYRENEDATVYEGFMYLGSWTHLAFVSSNGTIYGNNMETSKAYSAVAGSTKNCWSNGTAALSYIGINTDTEQWWQISLTSFTAKSDNVSATLKYDQEENTVSGVFTTAAANEELVIAGAGSKFDIDTGDGSGTAYTFTLELTDGDSKTFSFEEGTTGNGKLTVATAGTYRLTLDIEAGTWTIVETQEVVETYSDKYYMLYTWNSGDYWASAVASTLYSPDSDGKYTGFITTYVGSDYVNTDDKCHFVFSESAAENQNMNATGLFGTSADKYSLQEGSTGGVCLYTGEDISNPTTGLYYITLDLTADKWTETQLSPCLVGVNNTWNFGDYPLTFDSGTGLYSVTVDITENPYGLKILLDSGWEHEYGGSEGTLGLKWNGFGSGLTGKYTITVDLRDMSSLTYTMEAAAE